MVDVVPATNDLDFSCLRSMFGVRGDASRCFCQFFDERRGKFSPNRETNMRRFREQLASGVPGLVALEEGRPTGWVQVGPLERYERFIRAMRYGSTTPPPPAGAWAVTCFVVPAERRRSGVATELLRAAVTYAAEHGASCLDAHPVDTRSRASRIASDELYVGVMSTFTRQGFRVISRTSAQRPAVRKRLAENRL